MFWLYWNKEHYGFNFNNIIRYVDVTIFHKEFDNDSYHGHLFNI